MSESAQERLGDHVARTTSPGAGIRVVLCDDHQLLLEALSASLASHGFTIEATVESPGEAVRAVALHHPDVLVMDVKFPSGSGIDAAREVTRSHPRTKVVMFTGSDDPELMLDALAAGASGYLRKVLRVHEVAAALQLTAQGGSPVDQDLMRNARHPRPRCTASGERSPLDGLTERERHILDLLLEGRNTREIVDTLGVSPSTVRTHVQNIFTKLGVHSRLSAVALVAGDAAFRMRERDALADS